jgi:hypothetical protein
MTGKQIRKFTVLTDYGPQEFEDFGSLGAYRVGRHTTTGECALFQVSDTVPMQPSQAAPLSESQSVGFQGETLQAMPQLSMTERFAIAIAQGWAAKNGIVSGDTEWTPLQIWRLAEQFARANPVVH